MCLFHSSSSFSTRLTCSILSRVSLAPSSFFSASASLSFSIDRQRQTLRGRNVTVATVWRSGVRSALHQEYVLKTRSLEHPLLEMRKETRHSPKYNVFWCGGNNNISEVKETNCVFTFIIPFFIDTFPFLLLSLQSADLSLLFYIYSISVQK